MVKLILRDKHKAKDKILLDSAKNLCCLFQEILLPRMRYLTPRYNSRYLKVEREPGRYSLHSQTMVCSLMINPKEGAKEKKESKCSELSPRLVPYEPVFEGMGDILEPRFFSNHVNLLELFI